MDKSLNITVEILKMNLNKWWICEKEILINVEYLIAFDINIVLI